MATKLQITNYKHNNASSISDDGNQKLIEYNISNSPQIPKYGEIPQIANSPFNKSLQSESNSTQNTEEDYGYEDEDEDDDDTYSFFKKFEPNSNSSSNQSSNNSLENDEYNNLQTKQSQLPNNNSVTSSSSSGLSGFFSSFFGSDKVNPATSQQSNQLQNNNSAISTSSNDFGSDKVNPAISQQSNQSQNNNSAISTSSNSFGSDKVNSTSTSLSKPFIDYLGSNGNSESYEEQSLSPSHIHFADNIHSKNDAKKYKSPSPPQFSSKRMEIELIGQGGFGCVYNPEFMCEFLPPSKRHQYVSKIQYTITIENELAVSSIIKTIPNYALYFAPIEKTCPVNLQKLSKSNIKNCNILNKNPDQKEIISTQIRYVGMENIDEYIIDRIPEKILKKKIIYFFHYLLLSINTLIQKGICHFDIKPENILIDDASKVPIIIDFSVSFNVADDLPWHIKMRPNGSFYYIFSPEISICHRIFEKIEDKREKIDFKILKRWIGEFYKDFNNFIKEIGFEFDTTETMQELYYHLKSYAKKSPNQSWGELVEYIIENSWFHFDIYCLFITMAICVARLNAEIVKELKEFIQNYISLPFFARDKPMQIIQKTDKMLGEVIK